MKKTSLICAILVFIINFLLNWFSGILFEYTPILIISLVQYILNLIVFLIILSSLSKEKNKLNIIAILIWTIGISLCFVSTSYIKTNIDLKIFEKKYTDIIYSIKNNLFEIDANNNIKLPKSYSSVSVNGKVLKYNSKSLVLGFWIYTGLTIDNSSILVYDEKDSLEELENIFPRNKKIKKIKKTWYYVIN